MRRAGITEAEIIQLTLENVRSFYHRNPEVTTAPMADNFMWIGSNDFQWCEGLENFRRTMEKEYEEKAKLRIEQAKREEEALRQRSLAELEGRLQSAMDDLEKKSQIQHDAWVDALFSHIVGEEAERGDGGC